MKRNILWIVAACLLCLGFTGCQEPDEPRPVVPVLHLDEAQYVTTTTVNVRNYIHNHSSIGEFYYLLSTNENFQDSLVYKAALNRTETIYGLRPGTTYFYKLVGTDGNITVNSEVKSFTTLKGFSIAKLTYTDWDGVVREVDESMSPLGLSVVDTYGNRTRNLMVTYQNGEWRVPDEALGKDIWECAIYTPYNKDLLDEDDLGWLRFCTYKNGRNYVNDVLTGYTYLKDLKDEQSVSLRLSHALARVRFHFSIAEDCNEDNLQVQSFIINQEASSKIIPTIFWYSLYGKLQKVEEFSEIDSGESFVVTKKSQTDVTILSGETRSSGTVQARIQLSNGSTYSVPITLNADSWKSGKTYDYNIVYSTTGLTLSDVTVNEWNKNEGGDINIYE